VKRRFAELTEVPAPASRSAGRRRERTGSVRRRDPQGDQAFRRRRWRRIPEPGPPACAASRRGRRDRSPSSRAGRPSRRPASRAGPPYPPSHRHAVPGLRVDRPGGAVRYRLRPHRAGSGGVRPRELNRAIVRPADREHPSPAGGGPAGEPHPGRPVGRADGHGLSRPNVTRSSSSGSSTRRSPPTPGGRASVATPPPRCRRRQENEFPT
jgi:hypothetical protein